MKPLRRLLDVWINHPVIDHPATIAVAVTVFLIDPSPGLSAQDHGSFHQTLAAVSGILLSIGTIVITLVFTVTPNDRLEWVLQSVGSGLQRLVMRCLGGLIVTTVGFAALFVFDQDVDPRRRITLTAALVALASLRFLRLWWLLSRVLESLAIRRVPDQAEGAPWKRPVVKSGDYRLARRKPKAKAE